MIIVNTITKNSFNGKSNILFQKYESANESSSLNYLSTFDFKKLTFINGFSIKSNGNIKMGLNRMHGYTNWGNEANVVEKNRQLNTSYNSYDFIQKLFINLNKKEKIHWIDVRNKNEIPFINLPDVQKAPLDQIESKSAFGNENEKKIFFCQSGKRSLQALSKIKKKSNYFSLKEGANELKEWMQNQK